MQPVIAMHLTKKSVKKNLFPFPETQMMMNQWTKISEKENIENADNTDRTTEQWERMIHILYYDIDLQ